MNDLKTIFIVDDEDIMLQALSGSLSSMGYSLKTFSSAAEAKVAIQSRACDLIISDVNMPGQDGFSFLKEIKSLYPQVPVLLISGFGDIPKAVKAIKLGAFDFIEKPISEESLFSAVRFALDISKNILSLKLTAVEIKILSLVAEGKSSKEISGILGRSVRTVENHRHRMMKKLGISNASGLVSFAHENGLATSKRH